MKIITKEEFVKILTIIKDKRDKFDKLCEAMEDLSEGNYVNFWPETDYETIILSLLDQIFGFNPAWSPIDYFVVEGDFGTGDKTMLENYSIDDIVGDISTIEKLYDYCILLNKKEKENYE